jgi:hypothetical protein
MHAAIVSIPRFAEKFVRALAALVLSGSLLVAAPAGKAGAGRISIATQPPGATIYVDGQASGKAPAEIEGLGPGRYFVRAELDGYRAGEAVVEISSSQNAPSLALELISNSAPRRVEAAPVATPRPATPVPVPVATPAPATPAPVAAAPPRATPAPAPVLPPVVPAPEAAGDSDDTILRLVAAHLKTISDGDIDAYLNLCAPKVDLYDEGMQSKDSIRHSRQKLKERWPVYEITNVRDVAVRPADQPGVKRAAVTYDWNVSNPKTGKRASGTASDLLDFKQTGGQWLIVKARQNVDRKKKSGGQ